MEWLYQIDLFIFRAGNQWIANPVCDALFVFLTEVKNWHAVYLILWLGLILFGKKRGRIAALLIIPTIIIGDQLSSGLIKHLVGRIRPSHIVEGVRLIYGTGGGYSFPSSHAVNNFAMATLVARFFPEVRIHLYLFASLVAFSRLYLGVHYPSDIVAGAVIGSGVAWLVILAYEYIDKAVRGRLVARG